ncbi:Asp-tRNA(Asn)/Glu-tRNA(Gln) amidotransferase subunit GatC [Vallitalea pronyensis]|uniref:Asp-tRNA(Asn)/Glu-tRNA(Gln) amidotransferase subunit GatC n=1 Tax=Vallitalea pronyensis TaxID=1348613 RepID=UPI001BB01A83
MKITKEQIEHVANLARLNLTDNEKEQMTKDMVAIINFANQINEQEVENINPTDHVIPITNVFRKDEVHPSNNRDELLINAPSKQHGCFSVPKVVE